MIQLRFDTLAEAWTMNGHGAFVWASYGITFIALLILVIYPIYQQKKFLKDAALRHARMRKLSAQDAASSSATHSASD